jgi:hypothetical protein
MQDWKTAYPNTGAVLNCTGPRTTSTIFEDTLSVCCSETERLVESRAWSGS